MQVINTTDYYCVTNRNVGLIQDTWINFKNIIVSIKIMFQYIVQVY